MLVARIGAIKKAAFVILIQQGPFDSLAKSLSCY
jgi:hypothetical protein